MSTSLLFVKNRILKSLHRQNGKYYPIKKKTGINKGFYRISVLILSFNMDVLFQENEQINESHRRKSTEVCL